MTRFARHTLPCLASLLCTPACLLGPKTVGGDEDIGITSTGAASEDTLVATTNATTADPHGDEVVVCWEDLIPYAIAPTAEGDVFALATDTEATSYSLARVDDVGELWMIELELGRPDVITVTSDGRLAIGGAEVGADTSEARLWMLEDDGALAAEVELDPVFSSVVAVEENAGTLWTLTEAWGDGPQWSADPHADLRRHAADGDVELTLPFDDSAHGLAVGPGGEAYVAIDNFVEHPGMLLRIEPDGTTAWTAPLPFSPTSKTIIRMRPGGGVLVGNEDFPDVDVMTFDADGNDVASFTAAGASPSGLLVPLDIDDMAEEITLARETGPDELLVERRDGAGAILWTLARTFPTVTQVRVRAVESLATQTVIAGRMLMGSGLPPQGFIRFVDEP